MLTANLIIPSRTNIDRKMKAKRSIAKRTLEEALQIHFPFVVETVQSALLSNMSIAASIGLNENRSFRLHNRATRVDLFGRKVSEVTRPVPRSQTALCSRL